jgi:hypothetical protein
MAFPNIYRLAARLLRAFPETSHPEAFQESLVPTPIATADFRRLAGFQKSPFDRTTNS